MKTAQLDSDRQIIERLTDVKPPPTFEQTARAAIPTLKPGFTAADDLVDKFCGGQINETDFAARGIAIGMSLDDIHGVIAAVREEDGTYA